MVKEKELNLFEQVAGIHRENLDQILQRGTFNDGTVYFRDNIEEYPLVIGKEGYVRGCTYFHLITGEGSIMDRLKRADLLQHIYDQCSLDQTDWLDYVHKQSVDDGVFLLDTQIGSISRVRLSNELNQNVEDKLPPDFLSEDGSVSIHHHVGCKAALAVGLSSRLSDTNHSYIIKHTVYNSIGLGPLIHLNGSSMEIFFFRYDPESQEGFIDPQHNIKGILRSYKLDEGKYRFVSPQYEVQFNQDGHLIYCNNGDRVFQ